MAFRMAKDCFNNVEFYLISDIKIRYAITIQDLYDIHSIGSQRIQGGSALPYVHVCAIFPHTNKFFCPHFQEPKILIASDFFSPKILIASTN